MPGLVNINPQEGYIIINNLSESRISVYIFRKGGLYSTERRYLQTVSYTKSADE
jgi:hypothetical protein